MLSPNIDVSAMGEGINGTKLAAGFMSFIDGHIGAMVILAILLSGIIFIIREKIKKDQQPRPAP